MQRIVSTKGKVRVLSGGLHSLIVAYPGRIGYWRVGIPPSGPMDDYSLRIGNRIIGNYHANNVNHYDYENAAGLEITYKGPKLEFTQATEIAITGAKIRNANINNTRDISHEWYRPIAIKKGDVLDLTDTNISNTDRGCRTYLCVANGGFTVDEYLGSKTSFPMGRFGGPNNDGAVLKDNDILEYNVDSQQSNDNAVAAFDPYDDICTDYFEVLTTSCNNNNDTESAESNEVLWVIGVLAGPQSSPDYLTEQDVELLYATEYEVSHNASRLGIRLNPVSDNGGGKFTWARRDGGEGGSHPSNLIDNPYPVGSVNFTGDYPVILTCDGPSLGGFVCPITIPSTELWKVGQLKPSDKVRFKLLDLKTIIKERESVCHNVEFSAKKEEIITAYTPYDTKCLEPVLYAIEEDVSKNQAKVQYRMGGDRYLLIDYGEDEIDLNLRVRVHKLEEYLISRKVNGIVDTIPGVKTLLIEFDPLEISLQYLLNMLIDIEQNALCAMMDLSQNEICLPSRVYNLPFVFNDEWTHAAIQRYMNEVRPKAAYLPSNTQFICNNNGLEGGISELERLIYDISFLVLGLGDVYLGAPCAIPIDPRHRLNVPKYNPSRNYTPEGAVGIGGKFMCIYPMESPGGYQLVGRTLQIFNKTDPNHKPWLLNMFDQVRFYPVSPSELMQQRQEVENGKLQLNVTDSEFNLNRYNELFVNNASVQRQVDKLKANQKIYQAQQLKYDAYLLSQDDIAFDEIICKQLLWFQAQMIVNGPKHGTAMYIYIKQQFGETEDIMIDTEQFIKALNAVDGNEFSLTLYNKVYTIKLNGVYHIDDEEHAHKYDVAFEVNGTKYTVNDVIFDVNNAEYVHFKPIDCDTMHHPVEHACNGIDVNNANDPNIDSISTVLPGKLVKLHINIGDNINIGDVIATVSAMKMETPIYSHVKGRVVNLTNDDILSAKAVIALIDKVN